jgi:glyoxylase-like metal-dependent hydrolase (beta-lactamase superfamily II)
MSTNRSAVSAPELAARLGTADAPLVLDVRGADEYAEWHIPGSINIALPELGEHLNELPAAGPLVVVCATGERSARARAFLDTAGFDVADLVGGMHAWANVYDTAELLLSGVTVVQVRRRAKGCLSYVLGAANEAFVVDASLDIEQYQDVAHSHGWRITRVFDTHLHADHVSGARALAAATGASLHLNPADHVEFSASPLGDGDQFALPGEAELEVTAWHTPGHTPGSTVFTVGNAAVLTGDLLFTDGVGRPDLAKHPAEFAADLYRSLHKRVLTLPDETLVLPAHHREDTAVTAHTAVTSTIGALRSSLAPLQLARPAFVAWAAGDGTLPPPNYHEIVAANRGASTLTIDQLRTLELGPNHCATSA